MLVHPLSQGITRVALSTNDKTVKIYHYSRIPDKCQDDVFNLYPFFALFLLLHQVVTSRIRATAFTDLWNRWSGYITAAYGCVALLIPKQSREADLPFNPRFGGHVSLGKSDFAEELVHFLPITHC